jgi:hypothetical protein
MKWSYGVMTHPLRRFGLLPQTLVSLAKVGFAEPFVFVDSDEAVSPYGYVPAGSGWAIIRCPKLGIAFNWQLSMWELYLRNPSAERFALFQDDILASRDLRAYLEACPYPERGYLNLLTHMSNDELLAKDPALGWREAGQIGGGNPDRWQTGRGACGLVFSSEALTTLFCSAHYVLRPQGKGGLPPMDSTDQVKCRQKIDGGIAAAMNRAGWREYIHNPSLIQHVGTISTVNKRKFGPGGQSIDPLGTDHPYDWRTASHGVGAASWKGEDWSPIENLRSGGPI